ncbi:alcohol dehydrogenase [Rhodococcus sp. WS4]|nr:alcohol dehydrogenase [Rhodococcus sp. WS4]
MKAWQLDNIKEPLVLREIPDPRPGVDELVIDVKAAGICHSDVGFWDGTISEHLGHWPIVLGHEIAGVVTAVGSAVTSFQVGDRVGVPATMQGPGVAVDGGFAEKVVVREALSAKIPNNVSFELAAAATDAGISSYHAVACCGEVVAGQRVGLIGLGGLGLLGAQTALAIGADIYVAEVDAAKRESAMELGAVRAAADITEFADVQLDVIIDFAGFGTTTAAAIDTVRSHGRVVQVGLARPTGSINLNRLTFESLTLVGSSAGGDRKDLQRVFDLLAQGALRPNLEIIAFSEIWSGLDRLAKGTVAGRLIASAGA